MKNFEPSPIWSVFEGAESYEAFCTNFIPQFNLNEHVPDSIKNRIEVIRRLLEFSYFEYGFIDIALGRCYNTLELALHLKYQIECPNNKRKMSFKPYLDWAVKNKHLVITDEQNKSLQYLRNHITHLKEDSTMGIVGFTSIKVVGNKIMNDLFSK